MRDELTNTCLLPESAPLSGRRALPLRVDDGEASVSAVPEAEQCGWLKDKFGLSWQVVPTEMGEMMRDGTRELIARLTRAFLKMKKVDLPALREAYRE